MPLSGLGAAAVSAIGGLMSNRMTAKYNAEEAQKNRDFQMQMYKQQYDDSIKFWNMQNEYNLPSAELARLKDAGLNPLLMYGQGGVSGMSSSAPQLPSQPSGSQARAAFSNPLELAQYQLIDAQKEKLQAETQSISLQNELDSSTMNIRRLLYYGEYDKVNAIVADLGSQIRARGIVTTQQAISMSQARIYEIKRFNLDKDTIATQLSQGWENIKIGRINANAAMKQAAAAWQNAMTQGYITKWQVGAIAQDIWYKSQEQPYRLRNMSLQNALNRSGIRKSEAEIRKMGLDFYQKSIFGTDNIPSWMVPFFGAGNLAAGAGQ